MITGEEARAKSTENFISKNQKIFDDINTLIEKAIESGKYEVSYSLKPMDKTQQLAIIDYLTHLWYKVSYKEHIARDERARYLNLYEMDLYISW